MAGNQLQFAGGIGREPFEAMVDRLLELFQHPSYLLVGGCPYLEVDPVVRTGFSVFKWKDYSASRGRGGGNVKIGLIDFQGLVGRAGNGSIVFRAFHKAGISTGLFGRGLSRQSFWWTVEVYMVGRLRSQAGMWASKVIELKVTPDLGSGFSY